MTLTIDQVLASELKSRGIDSTTGIYGDHKLQIGNGTPIALDTIESNPVPGEGIRQATKINRGKAGLETMAKDTLGALSALKGGKLDVKGLLGAIKAGMTQLGRMANLGQLTEKQRENTMWIFTRAVEGLSNEDLARVYQSFTSKEMDLLQSALAREVTLNREAGDAGFAADVLFDLNALVIKEVSNRATLTQIDEAIEQAQSQEEKNGLELMKPRKISETYGSMQPSAPAPVPAAAPRGDMTAMNLMALVEVSSFSATQREKQAESEAKRLERRGLGGVSVTEMGDVLRKAELTINMKVDVLFKDTSILKNPDQPLLNIFQLQEKKLSTKTKEYIQLRDTAEQKVFPEFSGHKLNSGERPIYGALNLMRHSKGAVANGEFGNVCIVLKDNVKQRSTYACGDTFYAPKLKITPARKENFYRLLDGAGISPQTAAILRDPNSQAHRKLESVLNKLAFAKNPDTTAFKTGQKATGLSLDDAEDTNLRNLLFQCFVDSEATHDRLATYDSLESMVGGLDDIDGNMIALTAQKNRQGVDSHAKLGSGRYIEAQIHGPVVPTRDIAEIRVDLSDLAGEFGEGQELTDACAELREFSRRTGIPVRITNAEESQEMAIAEAEDEARLYSDAHIDREATDKAVEEFLSDLDGFVRHATVSALRELVPPASHLTLTEDERQRIRQTVHEILQQEYAHSTSSPDSNHLAFHALHAACERVLRPRMDEIKQTALQLADEAVADLDKSVPGYALSHPEISGGHAFVFAGDAKRVLSADILSRVLDSLATKENPDADLPGLVKEAVEAATRQMIESKAGLLEELDHADLSPEEREFFAGYVLSDAPRALSREALAELCRATKARAGLIRGILGANPPKTTEEIISALKEMSAPNPVLDEALPADTAASLALSLFASGEPAPDIGAFRTLRDSIDSEPVRLATGMFKKAAALAPAQEDAAPVMRFAAFAEGLGKALCTKVREMDIAEQTARIAQLPPGEQEAAHLALETKERPYSAPPVFMGNYAMIPDSVRQSLAAIAPAVTQALGQFPAFAPFPAPAAPQSLPQTDRQRKDFMVRHLHLYLNHEKTFERGKSTHGRGHIARAFIFANVMSNILIEKGIKVDKNAVMLGISGHDSGRKGGNDDRWEADSAELTQNLIRQDYGDNSMGEAYGTEVGKCINAHQSPTVEGMLLNSADSLDIGRTKDFNPQYFAFLKPAEGEQPSEEATQLRAQLIKEADILQRLTDPYCMYRHLVVKYVNDCADDSLPEPVRQEMETQFSTLTESIQHQFIADWEIPPEEYFANYENIILNNPELFPTLSKYYTGHKD